MSAATCHAHLGVPATASCSTCFRALCDVCTHHEKGLVVQCSDCLRRKRRAGKIVQAVLALAALSVVATGAYRASKYEKPYDYGDSAAEVLQLSGQLDKEPCDRRKILALTELMTEAGDSRGALNRADAFLHKCGEYPRLRWITYRSHKQLSEWELAAAEATKLIESSPYDADYRGWRGMAYEGNQDWPRAANDFRQALVLRPRLLDLPINLADAYERMGKPCEAIFPLEQVLYYYPDLQNRSVLLARINDLSVKGSCVSMAGVGRAQLRVAQGESIMRVTARLEDRENGVFIVDTGASYVTITHAFAQRLRLELEHAPKMLLQTANGVQTGFVITIEKIELQGVKAARVPAVVIDELGDGVDGLLGLSFLSRFELRKADGVLELSARQR